MALEALDPTLSINPSAKQVARFLELDPDSGFSFVNIHQYHDVAQYKVAPPGGTQAATGREAYHHYLRAVISRYLPHSSGSRIVVVPIEFTMVGAGQWHEMVIGYYPSREAALKISVSPGYEELAVHREAGLKAVLTLAVSGDVAMGVPLHI